MAATKKAAGRKTKSKPAARRTAKKAARKAPARAAKKAAPAKKTVRAKTKAKPKRAAKKRAPNPAFMKPMTPSPVLAVIVGTKPLPRTEVTKKVWAYIKKNNLQDAKERRNINADPNLLKVFGGKKTLSMFAMTKAISKHLK